MLIRGVNYFTSCPDLLSSIKIKQASEEVAMMPLAHDLVHESVKYEKVSSIDESENALLPPSERETLKKRRKLFDHGLMRNEIKSYLSRLWSGRWFLPTAILLAILIPVTVLLSRFSKGWIGVTVTGDLYSIIPECEWEQSIKASRIWCRFIFPCSFNFRIAKLGDIIYVVVERLTLSNQFRTK